MIYARQSTAIIVTVGPVLDADGVAVTDGVVGDFKISKNGGAPAALNGSATLTHRNTGHYSLSLTATDVNTVGTAEIVIDDTVNSCPVKDIQVVEEAVYDALFAASAPGYVANAPVNVAQFGGSNGTFSGGRPEVNTSHWGGSTTPVTNLNTVFNTDFAANYNTTNDGWVVKLGDYAHGGTSANTTLGTLTVGGTASFAAITTSGTVTFNAFTVSNATTLSGAVSLGSTLSITGAITATNASNNLRLGTFTVDTNAIAWSAAWDAEVQSEVQDAIEANHLDHLIAVADPGGIVANSSFLAKLVSKSATPAFSSYDNTTDSAEAIRDRGDAAWITATGFSTHSVSDIWSNVTRTLTAGTNIQLPSNGLANVTAWTVNITGSLTGSVGSVTGAVGSVTGAVGSVTGSVGSIATDGITAAAVSAAAANKIADHNRRRTQANVEASSDGDTLSLLSLYGFIQQAQESAVSGATLTVKKTDGTTTLGTRTLTVSALADPVTGVS